jgi:Glycosyl hydrolase family 134
VFDPAPLRKPRAMISPVNPAGYRGTATPANFGTAPGLPARKAALRAGGGTLLDLAVAMLETEHMDPSADYPFGDGKTEDAANFGIFKQNWHYIRTSGAMPPRATPVPLPNPVMTGTGLDKADWLRGAQLNEDLDLDVRVLHASQASLGLNQWFAAHRQGETGQLAFQAAASGGPTTAAHRATLSDVANYQSAVEWIVRQLASDPAVQTDDRKVFVQVPPV